MQISRALMTLANQWQRCALRALLIVSVLVAGVSPCVVAQGFAGSEEIDTPCEEQEEEEREVAKFSQQSARYSKGNLKRWYHGDRRSRGFSCGTRHAIQGHCLPNGLRAPLLH